MANDNKFVDWWDEHPLLKNFYAPAVMTLVLLVTILDYLGGRV